MGTPRERLFLAQNPLFRRILLDRNFCSDTSERHGIPELTLRTPEGKTAPACRTPSQLARVAQWPTRDNLPNTLRRTPDRCCRVW